MDAPKKGDEGASSVQAFDFFRRCCIVANIHLQNENEEQPDKMLHNGGSAPKGKDN